MQKFINNAQRRSIDTKLHHILSSRMAKTGNRRSMTSFEAPIKSRTISEFPFSKYELTEHNVRDIYVRKCEELDIEMKEESCDNFTKKFLDAFHSKSCHLGSFCLGATGFTRAISFFYTLTNIYVIDLSMNHIEDAGAIALSEYLASDPQVIEIDLRSNLIGSKGSAAIMKSLENNTHLQSIDMSAIDGVNRNKIGITGAKNLAESLGINQVLTDLNLSYYGFGAEECVFLGETMYKNNSIVNIDLSDNKIGSKGCTKLFKSAGCLGAIKKMNLSKNEIGDAGITNLSKQLMHNHTLRVLDLSHNVITVKGLTKLLGALQIDCEVVELSLAYNKLNPTAKDTLTNFVRTLKKIRSFNIAGNPLKDECILDFLHTVQENDNYISLNISDTFITDKCTRGISDFIKKSHKLQKFYIAGNSLTDKTGVPLANALAQNSTLHYISLRNCELKDRTAETFIDLMQQKKRFPEMDLQFNNFSYKAFSHLNSVIEYSKMSDFTSIAVICQQTIEKLGEDEKVLNHMRNELVQQRGENEQLKIEYDATAENYKNLQEERTESIKTAKQEFEETKAKYQELLETRRKAIDEYNDLRIDYEAKERGILRERQQIGQSLRAAENRLRNAEDKRLEATQAINDTITQLTCEKSELLLKLQGVYEMIREIQKEDQLEKEKEKENLENTVMETAMKGMQKMIDDSPKSARRVEVKKAEQQPEKRELKIPQRSKPVSNASAKSSSRLKVSKVTLRASTSLKPTKI